MISVCLFLVLYSDVNMESEFAIPESRLREITMPDDSHQNLDRLDNLMDMGGGFGEGDGDLELSSLEVLRDAIAPQESLLHESRDRPELEMSKTRANKSDTSMLSIEKGPVNGRDSFGLGFGDMDGGFGPGDNAGLTSLEDLGAGLPSIDDTADLLGIDESRQDVAANAMETDQLPSDKLEGEEKRSESGSAMTDFTLASLDVSTVAFKKPRPPGEDGQLPPAKKRKSTVNQSISADAEVKLSTNEIRSWFQDQTDIEVDIISAPSSRIALLPRFSTDHKLAEASNECADEELASLLRKNCMEGKKEASDVADADLSMVDDVLRDVGPGDEHFSMSDMDNLTLEPLQPGRDSTANLTEEEAGQHTRESFAGFGDMGLDTFDHHTMDDPLGGIELPALEEEPAINGEEEPGDTGPKEDEQPDEYERRRWNKKTQAVLSRIDCVFGKQGKEVPFKKLLESSSRKQAATQFFSLLLLTTRGTIKLQQSQPYGDIRIAKGSAYQACLS